jgi:hypothetical protein
MSEQPFYRSSNGDLWYLSEDPTTGSEAIKHVGNPESGGHVTYVAVQSFLASGNGPEHQAFRRMPTPEPMTTVLIAYDVHPATGSKYHNLTEAIQSLGAWWHHLETVWIVRSSKSPEELRDHLQTLIGHDDQIFVADITNVRASWAGLNEAGSDWLKQKIDSRSAV